MLTSASLAPICVWILGDDHTSQPFAMYSFMRSSNIACVPSGVP